MALNTPQPYDVDKILSTLEGSRQSIADTLASQEAQFAKIEQTISDASEQSRTAIDAFRQSVTDAFAQTPEAPARVDLERTVIDIEGIVKPMRDTLSNQLTNMKNAYRSQAQVQAKQLDAAVGAGAFGGNSYRAQQAYQSAMNELFNQTAGQIANVAISAEQTIMGAVAELSSVQAELDFRTMSDEAKLNVEQDIRHRELANNREVAMLTQLGNVAAMTVEAGATLTNNWLNLMSVNNQSVTQLVSMMANLDVTEMQVRQQLARDVFGAEMQAITNNMQLQQAYVNAAAQRYVADMQYRASKRASRAQEYVAELNAETQMRMADVGASAQVQATQLESQSAVDLVKLMGIADNPNADQAEQIAQARESGLFTPQFIF
jgi:hypothetical protein